MSAKSKKQTSVNLILSAIRWARQKQLEADRGGLPSDPMASRSVTLDQLVPYVEAKFSQPVLNGGELDGVRVRQARSRASSWMSACSNR
jgi:hypothetical protein